jgi:DNA-binding response OmpR family regulator
MKTIKNFYLMRMVSSTMELKKPRLILALENDDASAMMAGVLWMKGCEIHKANTATGCLEQFKKLDSQVDVVIMSAELALDRDAMLIINIKRGNMETKILAIGDENSDKTRILDYGADEFALKPMSPENVADKILMLLARETVAENRNPE